MKPSIGSKGDSLMRVASIDIGTNTMLLLIADIDRGGEIHVVSDRQRIVRLGASVDKGRVILPDAFERCGTALLAYRQEIRAHGVERTVATGTSALRDARNREEFIAAMRDATGIEIRVLSGEEEARFTYHGALSGFPGTTGPCAVLDIGGGSTELTIGTGSDVSAFHSTDVGAVRLTEQFFRHAPPLDEEIAACERALASALAQLPDFDSQTTILIGVAGTITTLAALELGLESYDPAAVAGHPLALETIRKWHDVMRGMNTEELRHVLRIDPGRADVMFAGVTILRHFMQMRGVSTCIASERGLRFGTALDAARS
ncbi:MAG: Ppx/GppA phosphatase family protein [Bacteroidota bacterium]|nr:Ppx/GppA phosphatase family protein [Bacteroidota bacterium]